jgi:hypothetical protein
MKTIIIPIALILFLFGCSENSKSDNVIQSPTADSMNVDENAGTAAVDEKMYNGTLTDLSKERNIEKLLCQGWEMEDDMEMIENNGDAEGIYPFRCFYLSDDFTYVRNARNFMEHGQWQYNDEKKMYKIAAIGPGDMTVINSGINSVTKLKFIGSAKKYSNKKIDPYYIDNNRWRIKPKFSENDSLVKKRLKDCIWFYVLFYKDNLVRKATKISFYGFPTCLKWYGGGIYMVKENELADNWFKCFYNKEQAMKAYRMMENTVVKKYKWSKGNISWVKKNLEVLEQMYANL